MGYLIAAVILMAIALPLAFLWTKGIDENDPKDFDTKPGDPKWPID